MKKKKKIEKKGILIKKKKYKKYKQNGKVFNVSHFSGDASCQRILTQRPILFIIIYNYNYYL